MTASAPGKTPIKAAAVTAVLAVLAHPGQAQGFSCAIGDQPACLSYGETVCTSRGKCVSNDAACFDQYQCNFEGFTCRSNLTDCADDYDELLATHNELVDDYNAVLDDRDTLLEITEEQQDALDDVATCLIYAASLEDARLCSP